MSPYSGAIPKKRRRKENFSHLLHQSMIAIIIYSTLFRSHCFSFVSRGSALSPPERIPIPRILLVCSCPSNIYLLIINIFLSILWLSIFRSWLGTVVGYEIRISSHAVDDTLAESRDSNPPSRSMSSFCLPCCQSNNRMLFPVFLLLLSYLRGVFFSNLGFVVLPAYHGRIL